MGVEQKDEVVEEAVKRQKAMIYVPVLDPKTGKRANADARGRN
jgi:hypothetical protein